MYPKQQRDIQELEVHQGSKSKLLANQVLSQTELVQLASLLVKVHLWRVADYKKFMNWGNYGAMCVARAHHISRDPKRPTYISHTNIGFLVICKRQTIGIQLTQVRQQMLFKTYKITWYRA